MQTALIQIDPPKTLAIHSKPTRVKGGDFVGVVPGTAIVPVITLDRPEPDYRLYECRRLDPVPHADRVEIGWELVRRTDEQIIQSIKQAAGEVIVGRFNETAQRNMTADAVLIQDESVRTDEMTARVAYYKKAFAWIRSVRAKSNELEAALIDDGSLPSFSDLEVPFV